MDALTEFVVTHIAESPASYALIAAFVALDAVFPLIPAEVVVITAALVALQGTMALAAVYGAGVIGVLIGDDAAYLLGDKLGVPAAERLAVAGKARRLLRWAKAKMRRHGSRLVVAGRFLPGGRTAAAFAAGSLDLSWRRFIVADVAAALLAIGYWISLAYIGGRAFSNNFWASLGLSLAIAVSLLLVFEGWERHRRRPRDTGP
jgi:membrane-associated protein